MPVTTALSCALQTTPGCTPSASCYTGTINGYSQVACDDPSERFGFTGEIDVYCVKDTTGTNRRTRLDSVGACSSNGACPTIPNYNVACSPFYNTCFVY